MIMHAEIILSYVLLYEVRQKFEYIFPEHDYAYFVRGLINAKTVDKLIDI